MGNRLKGRAAVVTGAGRGIGEACARLLAAEGCSVVVNDLGVATDGSNRSNSAADTVVDEIKKAGGKAIANYDSVAEFDSAKKIIDSCVNQFGRIDILVTPHGILRDKMLHNMAEEDWDSVVAVHLKGTFNTIRHAVPHMREQGWGRIVTFTSHGWLGTVGQCNYSASKGGIVSLTYTSALELGSKGITVNCIAPGAKTRMTMDPRVVEGMKKKYEAGLVKKEDYETYINMPGPDHVAPIVVYLCTDQASEVNGNVFGSAGGKIALYSKPEEYKYLFKKVGEGPWTLDELEQYAPGTLLEGLKNPSPKKAA